MLGSLTISAVILSLQNTFGPDRWNRTNIKASCLQDKVNLTMPFPSVPKYSDAVWFEYSMCFTCDKVIERSIFVSIGKRWVEFHKVICGIFDAGENCQDVTNLVTAFGPTWRLLWLRGLRSHRLRLRSF